MLTIFNVALTNMMACRVYRHTRFGDFREETISTRWIASKIGRLDLEGGMGPLQFASGTRRTIQFDSTSDGAHDVSARHAPAITEKISPLGDTETGESHHPDKLTLSPSGESRSSATSSHEL
ncbi:hypothetical protein H0H81_005276 [Sphagnurus paluster]|uniref:Uncharacterized protein n=1 Tax=Sphagnurus paluster TaxID=117069 RepID=A0A9P7FVV6_9AGAR|nr:hypothetical protein H0H81_005276 [Sphagnurus paluster]